MTALSMKDRIAAKRGDIAAGKSKGVRPYKFKNGKTLFRILPSKDQVSDFWANFGQLYLKSFDGKDFVVIGDKYLTHGEEDPIREMVFDAMKHAPSEDVKEHYKEMLGGPRVIFNALILNDSDQAAKEPVLIEVSETQFDLILAQFQMYLDIDENHDLASLARGHVFQCEREGTNKNDTKYSFLATPQPAPLNEAILDKLIDMNGWVAALFEAKEQKALALLSKMGVNIGNASSVAGVLTAGTTPAAALTAPVTNVTNVSPAAVTTITEDDDLAAIVAGIEAAAVATPAAAAPVIEEAVFTTIDTPVTPVAAVAPVAAAPVTPAAAAPVATPVTQGAADIEAILASLG